jgi:hypothetical protein
VLVPIDELKKNGGDVRAFLLKQGLYSSTIFLWRKKRNEGLPAVAGKRRGPKPKVTPGMAEIQRLQKEKEKLSKSRTQVQKIIDIQRKLPRCTQTRRRERAGMARRRQKERNSVSGAAGCVFQRIRPTVRFESDQAFRLNPTAFA